MSAGYAVVRAEGTGFVVEKAEIVPQPASAQLAELVGLTEACLMAEGKRVTIYTDSAYAHNVCHLFGSVWKSRGFKRNGWFSNTASCSDNETLVCYDETQRNSNNKMCSI